MFTRKVFLRSVICAILALIPFPEQEGQIYDWKLKTLSLLQFSSPSNVLVLELSRDQFESIQEKLAPLKGRPISNNQWKEKFDEIRNQFFWDDNFYLMLLKRILSEKPRKVLVTFHFNEHLIELRDNLPLQKLARNSAVLWGSQFDVDQRHTRPSSVLTGTENYGFTNLFPDSDGVVRSAFLIKGNHMSLPFRALVEGIEGANTQLPVNESFLINFRGGPGYIPSCQVSDLLAHDLKQGPCGSLTDRYVILSSAGSQFTGDSLYRTPVGNMSKGETLANILLTAKEGNAISTLPLWLLVFLLLLHSGFIYRAVQVQTIRWQLLQIGVLFFIELALAMFMLGFFSLQIALVPFILCSIFAYVTFLWLKYQQQEHKRWQAEKESQYLKELDELKSNFTSLMSHDLKTPIAKVQALTERLAREATTLSSEQKDLVVAIRKSNEELSEYILSLLNFQKIESQEIHLHKKSHDINVLVEEVVMRLRPIWQEKNVRVEMELEPMFAIEFDEQLIKQVLTNIVDNAIKYNPAGTEVKICSRDFGDFVEVAVTDTGEGISAEQMPQLFKKFSRSEKSTAERVKGTGLGLYLSKYFIELHGGTIEVESAAGKGTTLKFRLPVQNT